MTDDAGSDDVLPAGVPGFDDPTYDDLRALLAGARVTEPVPAEVAARLDEALAVLDPARPVPTSGESTVVPLRPRRSTGSRILVAAAVVGAVAVGGVGLSRLVENRDTASTTADSSAAGSGTTGVGGARASTDSGDGAELAALPGFSSASFETDTVQFLARVDPARAYALDQAGSATRSPSADVPQAVTGSKSTPEQQAQRDLAALRATGCTPPTTGAGSSYAILLDGHPAVLVVRTAADGSLSAQALSCSGEVLAETTRH